MLKPAFLPFLFASFLLLAACNSVQQESVATTHSAGLPLFEQITAQQSGIYFNNRIEENFQNFFARFNYVYNGGGVAIGDINNDGLSDIYFTGNEVSNKLYLNKGDFEFEDITEQAMASGGGGWHNGVTMVDVNADGWLDIYICRGGWEDTAEERKNLLLLNDEKGGFTESAAAFGLDDSGYSLQAAFFDLENDGDLDLYLTNRPDRFFLDYQKVLQGKSNPKDDNRDKLYRNDNGKFIEIGQEAGIVQNYGYGLGLVASDFNKDGFTDLYIANDYLESDYLYINQGDGTFVEKSKEYTRHVPFYAMGVDAVDINNDGWEDLIELEMLPADYVRSKTTMAAMNPQLFNQLTTNGFQHQYMHNMLQLNRGRSMQNKKDIYFSEIAQLSGIAKTDWSWACLGADFDNDGWKDIFVSNGFRRDIWDKDANAKFRAFLKDPKRQQLSKEEDAQHIIQLFAPNKITNYLFRNSGDLTFSDESKNWGIQQVSFSNGASIGDLDNDGDLDLVVNNIEGAAFLYRNRTERSGRHYLKIKLKGNKKNPLGLGAKVSIQYGTKTQYHDFKLTRGYLSSVEPLVHFGLGSQESVDEVRVQWYNGLETILRNVPSNQTLVLDMEDAQTVPVATTANATTQMTDLTATYFDQPFQHRENNYDDYRDQILLPHKLSQTGPCLAVGDVNQDGLEDFFVGGASGQSGQLYLQSEQRKFIQCDVSALQQDALQEDVGAVFFDADGDEDLDLYVVSGGNESRRLSTFYQDRLYLNDEGTFVRSNRLPSISSSGSCVRPYDFDGDGDKDLFVGGRVRPGKYPHPPQSYLLRNDDGHFKNVTEQLAPELSQVGMVTDGHWQDIDGDGQVELVLVGEWMPISVFQMKQGQFQNTTKEWGLVHTNGWWNSLEASDVDQDGDIDFIAGNLGLNYKFKASEEKPFTVFAKDFDRNGTNDVFLAKYHGEALVPVRGKECSSQQIPALEKKFTSYKQFANSDIHDILEGQTDQALRCEAKTFESCWFENVDGRLQLRSLPTTAQFSTVNGILSQDVNGDQRPDLILVGNRYESEIETTRADASCGLVLLQEVTGTWRSTTVEESGLFAAKNVKSIQQIHLGKNREKAFLIGTNNDKIQLWKIQQPANSDIQ
ncbi:MAG: VCBS repeat-containing protein [Bacteroidota bacterium]